MQACFTTMCSVIADTAELVRSLRPQMAHDGDVHYEMEVDVVLLFGLTELKAQISWTHKVRLVIASDKLCHLHRVQGVEKR